MNQEVSLNPPSKEILNKQTLLERTQHYRAILEETIQDLDEETLSLPGPESWSIKDHLAHLAVWEQGMVELLNKRPRFAAMGVEQAFQQGKSETEINDLVFRQNKSLTVQETLQKFEQVHSEMLQLLDNLSDEELHKPYSNFVPGGDEQRTDPVIYWVIGNTYAHFDEHTAYIRRLLEAQ